MLYLNALLGLGTALAPVLVAVFLGIGLWWGLPLLVAILIAVLLAAASRLAAAGGDRPGVRVAASRSSRPGLPPAFWLFAGFALLYGIVETTSGNWATLYMTGSRRVPRRRSRRSP